MPKTNFIEINGVKLWLCKGCGLAMPRNPQYFYVKTRRFGIRTNQVEPVYSSRCKLCHSSDNATRQKRIRAQINNPEPTESPELL